MDKQDTKVLKTIRREFSRRGGRAIPERLRKLALSALHGGFSAGEIARAAGISRQSVVNWKRRTAITAIVPGPTPAPIELKVVESRPHTRSETDESASMARITLRSGAIVELPSSALDPRWLIALNEGAS